ncbi:uncharacterized protein L201_002425 [Kwoniella dendrophila CBS 6074]|uniref:Short-chain dehydrogenase/reductase 3 n=1 Tax=Kwoniella dendrophila CBS 6074 TaxID=1295534 RepID=A0AAX4JQ51_9TREE
MPNNGKNSTQISNEQKDYKPVPSQSKETKQPHLIFDDFNIDVAIKVLSATLFSPFFVIFLPAPLLTQTSSTHPAFIFTCIWTCLICLIGIWNHIDRIYNSGGSWLLAPKKLNWNKQIVLITGGGSGIGALLAETLAARNISVVVLTKYRPQFETKQDSIYTYICDVSDYKNVQAVAQHIREEVGDPTIIVNNAGVVKGKLLLDLTEDDITDTFGSNTLANFWVLKAFLPALLRKGEGHIVTVSSLLGVVGAAQMTDYCASKAALINLNQSLRFELDNRYETPNIRTTILLPSFIQTSLFSKIKLPTEQSKIFKFFCPDLEPHSIVKVIIDNLESRESKIIRLPFYTNASRFINDFVGITPNWLKDFVQHVSGADHAMVDYGPKPDAAERLIAEREKQKGE